jgi:hypothetical protein
MLVNLLRIAVLLEQVTQNANATHPQDLFRHTRVLSTTALTEASVATLKVRL